MASLVLRPAVGCLDSPTPLQRHEGTQTTHLRTFNSSRERKQLYQILPPSSSSSSSSSSSPMVVRAVTTGLVGDSSSDSYESNEEIKEALFQALKGIDRGIFGVTSAKRSEIVELVELVESRNPTPQPTDNLLDKVNGCWKLVYTTITILGAKRTKLGLRDFISLGDFEQTIDVAKEKAFNVIKFNVRGFNLFNGKLTIEASYKIASKKRVDIKLENSSITPDQLMNLFQKNYDLLLAIFNPEGWLDITYVDDTLRIGRDDKNNIFILERAEQEA